MLLSPKDWIWVWAWRYPLMLPTPCSVLKKSRPDPGLGGLASRGGPDYILKAGLKKGQNLEFRVGLQFFL